MNNHSKIYHLASKLLAACRAAIDTLECNCGMDCDGTCSYAVVKKAIKEANEALRAADCKWTVILMYPHYAWPGNTPEIYINHTSTKDKTEEEAIANVQKMAEADNHGAYSREEFDLIAIYEGHIDAVMTANI